ncbi:hypothetical protein BV917_14815 [Leptospira santarosai serovar Guaricura]|nr:hypothetical protein BV917_14815 [Leptospira santarosai serovar Guaricura]
MSSIRHFYVKTKCGSSHKLRFFSGLKEFFTMKFVYCGNDTDFVGVPHTRPNSDFLTPDDLRLFG